MKPKNAPTPSSAEAVEAVVREREDALAAIETDLAAAEARIEDLASNDDDDAFETASLGIERLRRAEVRALKRVEQAQEALAEAKEAEEAERRRGIFDTGQKAAAEAAKLASTYAGYASEIAETLRAIEALREPIEAANKSLPEGERRIDVHALQIQAFVELPATTEGGNKFWWRPDYFGHSPLNPPPPPRSGHIFVDGALVPFDAKNPAHLAAREAPEAIEPVAQPVQPSTSANPYGETRRADGTRVFRAPPCDWGTSQQSN